MITGSNFKEANLKDAVFDDALIGYEDVKLLCACLPPLGGRPSAGRWRRPAGVSLGCAS